MGITFKRQTNTGVGPVAPGALGYGEPATSNVGQLYVGDRYGRPVEVTPPTLTHSRGGAVHYLSGLCATTGIMTAQFRATAEFNEGNTFVVSGVAYSAKLQGEEGALPNKYFVAGDLVSVLVDVSGYRLGFKAGGGGGDKPKIYVQPTAPAGSEGEFWVQDSGYTLARLVTDVTQPTSLSPNALFLCAAFRLNTYRVFANKSYDIKTHIAYGQAYYGGWRSAPVFFYTGGVWVNIGVTGNRLYHVDGSKGVASNIYELDPNTFAVIKAGICGRHMVGVGGIQNRLFCNDEDLRNIHELDPNTLTSLKFSSAPTGVSEIGGIQNKLFTTAASYKKIYELDPNTLSAIKTSTTILTNLQSIGGTQNRLFASLGGGFNVIHEIDSVTMLSLRYASSPSTNPMGIGGMQNTLYHCDNYTKRIYELDPNTLMALKTAKIPGTISSGIGGTK